MYGLKLVVSWLFKTESCPTVDKSNCKVLYLGLLLGYFLGSKTVTLKSLTTIQFESLVGPCNDCDYFSGERVFCIRCRN